MTPCQCLIAVSKAKQTSATCGSIAHRAISISVPDDWRREIMARGPCITEMAMGVDVHGRDATKAAKRAVSDAIRHSSLGFFRMVGKTSKDMFVDVTIGVPDPS